MDYQRPMVTVDQNITVAPASVDREQPAFIFGPQYVLHRYADEGERATTKVDNYSGSEVSFGYPGVVDVEKVDKSYTKLYGENVVVELENLTPNGAHAALPEVGNAGSAAEVSFNGGYTKLLLESANYRDRTPESWLLYLTGSSTPVKLVKISNPTADGNMWSDTGLGSEGGSANFTYAIAPDLPVKGQYTLTYASGSPWQEWVANNVKDGASELKLLDTSDYSTVMATAIAEYSSSRSLESGDYVIVSYNVSGQDRSFMTTVKSVEYDSDGTNIDSDSSSEGSGGTLITVEDPVPNTTGLSGTSVKVMLVAVIKSIEFGRKNVAKYELTGTAEYQWEENGNGGITVHELNAKVTAGYFLEAQWCKVRYADLYLTYRELTNAYADNIHSISSGASGVYEMLGPVDPDNPLAMGVHMACLNAATEDGDEAPPVYFMGVPTNDEAGYDFVLNRASLTDRVYVFSPTTGDRNILTKVQAHVTKYSTKTEKLWRIAAGSEEVPETELVVGELVNNGNKVYAIPVSDDGGTAPSDTKKFSYLRLVMSESDHDPDNDAKLNSIVKQGDYVRFWFKSDPWDNKAQTYDTYKVVAPVSNSTVKVKSLEGDGGIDVTGLPQGTGSYVPQQIEIFHVYSDSEKAELIAAQSRRMLSRRMLNVFPDSFVSNGVTMGGEFAACAVAGLISATEPQQPITNMPIRGIDAIPDTYMRYSKDELDVIAAGGTFIVAQDLPNDTVYVRHQITTATSKGNINETELSITKNVDSISYAFADSFRPYYGKYNVIPELIAKLENICGHLISQLGGSDSVYGPQLIVEETTINYIRQNATYKDRVDVGITLGVPYPCNHIDIVLTV